MDVYVGWFKDSDSDVFAHVCSSEHLIKRWIREQMGYEFDRYNRDLDIELPSDYDSARAAWSKFAEDYECWCLWDWKTTQVEGYEYDPDNTRVKW
jgi:hypothetical protein